MNKNFIKITTLVFMVYLISWLFVYTFEINKLLIQSEDTLPTMFLPVTILKDQTIYADKYYEMIRLAYPHPDDKSNVLGLTPFYFKKIDNHYVTAFPLISGLLAIPVYALPILLGLPVSLVNMGILARISSMLIVALSSGFFYLLLKKHFLQDSGKATLLTIIYAFGTINFAQVSQSLWQHGTLELFLILSLYFLLKPPKFKSLFISGIFAGLAVLSRPTGALPVLLLILILPEFKKLIKHGFFYALGFVPSVLFFLWYNAKYYLSLSNQGYATQATTQWLSHFPEGFLGVWLSPSKGILIYSPVFLLFGVSAYLVFKKINKENFRFVVFFAIALLHTLVIGMWKHWYGGWSFGYRMSSDIIPFLVLCLVPYVKSDFYEKTKRVFFVLIGLSIVVQLFGMVFFDGIWHAAYDGGFQNTGWLWSVGNSELVFNLRRILVKLGWLAQACPKCLSQ